MSGVPNEAAAAVLAARARALARPLASTSSVDDALAALVVRAGASTYAVPLADVVEILPAGRITPLPGAAAPVVGVVAWRGRVLAVLALVPDVGGAAARPVVVVGDARTPLALVVDAIDEIRRLPTVLAADSGANGVANGVAHVAADLLGVTPDAVAVLDVSALRRRVAAADAVADDS